MATKATTLRREGRVWHHTSLPAPVGWATVEGAAEGRAAEPTTVPAEGDAMLKGVSAEAAISAAMGGGVHEAADCWHDGRTAVAAAPLEAASVESAAKTAATETTPDHFMGVEAADEVPAAEAASVARGDEETEAEEGDEGVLWVENEGYETLQEEVREMEREEICTGNVKEQN